MIRHVFLASVGLSLPVVTESLWALMNPPRPPCGSPSARPPVFADRVHVVTTAPHEPAPRLPEFDRRRELLRARVAELYAQHGRPPPEFLFEAVADPEATDGCPFLADVRDARENILYANHITRRVRDYCADPDTVLHMSLAGGRKTMSSYDHTAMMFFGRVGDDLSHVLVTPAALEGAREQFWWPGQTARTVRVRARDGTVQEVPTTPDAVTVELVPVPFVRLGVRLPSGIPPEAEDYEELIEFVEFERNGGVFVVDADTRTIRFGRHSVVLPKKEFVLFSVLAIARKQRWAGVGPEEEGVGGNAAGWVFLNDLRAGWVMRDGERQRNASRAFACLRALLEDEQFTHGDSSGMLKSIESNVVKKDGTCAHDPTGDGRSKLREALRKQVRSPYVLRYLVPQSYTHKSDTGSAICIGLSVPADRIELHGFRARHIVG